MKTKRISLSFAIALLLVVSTVGSALAGSVSSNGMTMIYPSYPLSGPALQSCEPWNEPSANTISLSGIPEGAKVEVTFAWANPYMGSPNYLPTITFNNVTGGSLVVPVSYPMDTTQWPVFNSATNERAIAVSAFVRVTSGGIVTKLVGKQWWVRCQPPLRVQGCTPGYWRQDHHFDSWVATGYAPGDDFEAVFGVDASFDPHTMLDAVWLGGGGEFALARHAVAALLNASSPDVDYFYSAADVIAGVQAAYASGDFEPFKSALDFANNAGCPLN